ncbi:hypothetical protein KKE33_02860 [Patescibacteria group bacterium]|nr:hypothetical protein [Patescibacteria group bacterium]
MGESQPVQSSSPESESLSEEPTLRVVPPIEFGPAVDVLRKLREKEEAEKIAVEAINGEDEDEDEDEVPTLRRLDTSPTTERSPMSVLETPIMEIAVPLSVESPVESAVHEIRVEKEGSFLGKLWTKITGSVPVGGDKNQAPFVPSVMSEEKSEEKRDTA